jgi:hypothetical protein
VRDQDARERDDERNDARGPAAVVGNRPGVEHAQEALPSVLEQAFPIELPYETSRIVTIAAAARITAPTTAASHRITTVFPRENALSSR